MTALAPGREHCRPIDRWARFHSSGMLVAQGSRNIRSRRGRVRWNEAGAEESVAPAAIACHRRAARPARGRRLSLARVIEKMEGRPSQRCKIGAKFIIGGRRRAHGGMCAPVNYFIR